MFIKPKFWDLKKPIFLSYLLLPFTILIMVNNFLLKFKTKKKFQNIKTICVGNIYVGGTGKTPTTVKLYSLLKKINPNICTAKKYYSSQFDEHLILNKKTKFISEKKRKMIIEKAIKNNFDLVIFDDGLQEKKVNYDLQFVCFDAQNWIGNGFIIPSGPLRENLNSLIKYDGIFLRNSNSNNEEIITTLKKVNPRIEIFKTKTQIANLNKFDPSDKYIIFSGIGNPKNFKNLLLGHNFNIVKEIIFPDHFKYNNKILEKIKIEAQNLNAKIITTEKDFIKIPYEYHKDITCLEINLFIQNEDHLINFIQKKLYG